jgi:transposase
MIIALNDKKWSLFEKFFSPQKRGRSRIWNDRIILEAILYILRNGCTWADLPKSYPPKSTVYDRFRLWCRTNVFEQIRNAILEILVENGMNISVAYIDATFVRGCLGGDKIGITKCGKGSKIMTIVNDESKPLAAIVTSARPHELRLIEETLGDLPDVPMPSKIVGDRAYDSDSHDQMAQEKGIKLIAPHRKNRTKKATQNSKELQEVYKERWRVERFFAWTKYARRLLNRFEKRSFVFQAFLDLFSGLILMKDMP